MLTACLRRAESRHTAVPEMTIREAARALGTSADTIRRRIRRGELNARRDSRGWLMVHVPAAQGAASPMQQGADLGNVPMAEVMQRLEEENRWLRSQLDEAARERAELRQLLAGSMRSLPAGDTPADPQSPLPFHTRDEATPAPGPPVTLIPRRGWLRRLLGL